MSSKAFPGIIIIFVFFLFLPIVAQGASLIDINTAFSKELEKIIGIGPVLAQRTIEARPFNSLDDLIKVKGIGEKTLQKIKDQGLAWVSPQEELEPKPVGSSDPTAPSDDGAEPEPAEARPPQIENTKKVEDGPLPVYPSGIVFSEILPSPEGADAENEWIEVFNQNNFEVDISGWEIKDKIGRTTNYIFSANTKISPLGYLVLKRPESKITLNNSGDELEISNPNRETADSLSFGKATIGQSYNKINGNWLWSVTLTPGTKNIISSSQIKEKSSLVGKKTAEDGPPQINFAEKETAIVGEKIPKFFTSFLTLLISSAIAIFSAIIILILKKTITKKHQI